MDKLLHMQLHTLEGIFDKKGKPVIDKKTKEPKKIPDPDWILNRVPNKGLYNLQTLSERKTSLELATPTLARLCSTE